MAIINPKRLYSNGDIQPAFLFLWSTWIMRIWFYCFKGHCSLGFINCWEITSHFHLEDHDLPSSFFNLNSKPPFLTERIITHFVWFVFFLKTISHSPETSCSNLELLFWWQVVKPIWIFFLLSSSKLILPFLQLTSYFSLRFPFKFVYWFSLFSVLKRYMTQ